MSTRSLQLFCLVLAALTSVARAETRPSAAPRAAAPAARAGTPATAARAGAAPVANAASDISAAEIASLLSKNFEARAVQTLERYLPAREFSVSVDVTPSNTPLPRAPYEPRSVTAAAIANRSPEDLAPYIRQVKASVALTGRLMSSRKRIDELLTRALRLDTRRGDAITYSNLGIAVEDDSWVKEKGDMRQEMSVLKQENDKLNRELAVAEQQLKQREQALSQKEKDLERAKQEQPLIPEDLQNTLLAVVGGFFLIILVVAFLVGRSVSSSGRNVSGGLSSIAAAFENIGGQIGAGRGESEGGGVQSLEAKLIAEGGKGGSALSGGGLATLPIDTISTHLLKTRNEILENMNESTEAVIMRYLTTVAQRPEYVGRAVVALELLGRDVATPLFRRLNLATQEAILTFLREGVHARSKMEIMLEVGEELKTKLLVESFDKVRGAPSEKVGGRLVELTDEDFITLAANLDPTLLPRLFLYLTPEKIAFILSNLRKLDPKQFEKSVAALPHLPDAESAEQHDADILKNIDAILDKNRNDAQRPFLKVYQEIVERSEDEVGETIIRELSTDPRLSNFLRENIINVHTFFKLTEDARAEMIETMSNKDVAAFATGVDEAERNILFDSLPARRASLIQEEYDTFVSRGGNAAELVFKKVKETIVKRLKTMKEQGLLAGAMQPAGEGATDRPSTPSLPPAEGGDSFASDEPGGLPDSGSDNGEGEAA